MQHLIKVNLIVYVAAVIAGVASLTIESVPLWNAFATAAKVASVIQFICLGIIYFAWRWIPGFAFFIFPNLSGDWTGSINVSDENGGRSIEAVLHIEQNVSSLSLMLTTEQAESETIVVYPRRLSNRRLELLYVYETHKKEVLPHPHYRYRGTAVIRLEGRADKLAGNYYTEQGGKGTVAFARKPAGTWLRRLAPQAG